MKINKTLNNLPILNNKKSLSIKIKDLNILYIILFMHSLYFVFTFKVISLILMYINTIEVSTQPYYHFTFIILLSMCV